MDVNGIQMSIEEFNALSNEKVALLLTTKRKAATASKKKASINGAPLDVEPTVSVEGDTIVFKHKEFKRRAIALSELRQASEKFNAGEIVSENKRTGTPFVEVERTDENGKVWKAPIGKNLVVWAQQYL